MLTYYLVAPFIYFFAYLPTPLLLKISDFLAFVLEYIIKYRKKVILENLSSSFPEKNEDELIKIKHTFYRHLSDRIVENIRCIGIPKDEFLTRCTITNMEYINSLYEQKRDIVVMIAHSGAWEWAGYTACTLCKHKVFGVYSPTSNPHFNDMVVNTRGKYGMHLISMKETSDYFKQKNDQPSLHIFFTDQSPKRADNSYWTKFLNQDTAFFYGAARYAKSHNCVVLYIAVTQVKRGFFNVEIETISENPKELTEDQIVQKYADILERRIRNNPSDWLWSHKRWKHKKPTSN